MTQKFKSVVTQGERAKGFYDKTDELFNSGLALEFYHIPSRTSVSFKAYITNLVDSFNQSWNSEKVIGRSDPFHNYENTERVINLGWKIVASSEAEAKKNMMNISLLAMMNYPKYDQGIEQALAGVQNATTITESPLFRVKLMNLITSAKEFVTQKGIGQAKLSGLSCRIDGFSFTHEIEDGYFSTTESSFTVDNTVDVIKVYPKTIQASCTLYITHDHALGWSSERKFRGTEFYPYREAAGPALDAGEEQSEEINDSSLDAQGDFDVAEALRKTEIYGAGIQKIVEDPFAFPDELQEVGIDSYSYNGIGSDPFETEQP